MWQTLNRTYRILTPQERVHFLRLLFIVTGTAFFEVVSVASIMPFIAVLANPDIIETNRYLRAVNEWFGFETPVQFLILLGCASFVLLVMSALVRIFGNYATIRFSETRRHSLATRLFQGYLAQPYTFFMERHSGDLTKTMLSEVDMFVGQVLRPTVMMIGQLFMLTAIIMLLLIVDPWAALSAGGVIGLGYMGTFLIIRNRLQRAGEARQVANANRFKATSDSFSGVKDIKLLGREAVYLERFKTPSFILSKTIARASALAVLPRYAIEAVAFGGLLTLTIILMIREDGALERVLPLLGLFAYAGYRMLPAVQTVYQGFTKLGFGKAIVDTLHRDLTANAQNGLKIAKERPAAMGLRKDLVLDNVTYEYRTALRPSLRNVSIRIEAATTVGIVGGTGAGKTTLIDVILGLLVPQTGRISIDGTVIDGANRTAGQAGVGYVPQEIVLLDGTIRENIAFGLPETEIDNERVRHCALMARIDHFIENELPHQYETSVGERGVRLSGGQRQRIGIARALYHDPDLLVFDEATSALDNLTEREVMEEINALAGTKTIIMIAHRLTTVEACDQIVVLSRGQVAATGTYEELMATSAEFRSIASATEDAASSPMTHGFPKEIVYGGRLI